jgi:hemoglobin/transferrin/lactoferrin receptor protein
MTGSTRTRGSFVLAALLTLGSMPCIGSAQTNLPQQVSGTVTGAEIIVTATRVEQDLQSIPCTAYELNGDQVQMRRMARTTPEALKGIPSVLVQKTSHGQGSPYLRGFTGFRTLSLIDGVRLNNSVFRDGPNQYWNTIDAYSLQGYELVMGPSSVLYGSDAIGGTLNALTVEPPDFNGQPTWGSRLHYRGASAERSSIGRVEVGGRPTEQLGFIAGISLKDFGDLEGGKDVGRQKHTGYDEQDYDARVDYNFSPDSRLTFAHQAVDLDDAWRTHRTIYGLDWEGLAVGDEKKHSLDQQRDLTYLKYRGENLNGGIDGVQISLSRQDQQEDQFRVKKDSTSDQQGFDVETWGSTVQMESDTDAGTWVYGAEYYRDQVDSYGRKYKADGSLAKTEIQGPVADDASYDSLGLYIEDNIQLLNGQLELVPGARYTYSKADAAKVKDPVSGRQMSVEDDWDAVVGSLKLLHPLVEQKRLVAFAGVSQGFRAPNLSDLTRLDTARSNEIETPVSDLDPEQFVACEAGLKARFERWTSQLAYYRTFIDDMIVRTPTGREIDGALEVTKKNSGRGYVQGVEWSGACDITPAWSTWLTASWMDGRVDAYPTSAPEVQREYITRLMPPTAEVGLRWQRANGKYWAEALCDAADKADKLSADDQRDTQRIPPGGTPGYAVFTARGGSRITKNLELTLAVENLLDEDYRIHGSGVNEPGRNYVLAADYRF